jgi:chromosome segregation ATPase
MSSKTIKPSAAERKIKRLKAEIKTGKALRAALRRQHTEYRLHAGKTLAEHLFKARRAEETLAANNMTIQELNNQVAVQWQQRAESRSDVERATNLTAEAVAKHNRMAESLRESYDEKRELANLVGLLRSQAKEFREALAEAQRSFSNRTWEAITLQSKRTKAYVRYLRWQIRNRWLVWRLNKPRIEAMSEAGYIPSKLIKMAERYWDEDKARSGEMVYSYAESGTLQQARQTPWRRFRIWMGRA